MHVNSTEWTEIHIFEPGGEGGVFQHSLAVSLLLTEAGKRVTFHTAAKHEIEDPRVTYCNCVRWAEYESYGRFIKRGIAFATRTVPHLLQQNGLIWIQGTFRTPITLALLALLRAFRKNTLFSPHNLFTRHGGKIDQILLDSCVRTTNWVMTYNQVDQGRLSQKSIRSLQTRLFTYAPAISEATARRWEAYVRDYNIDVCSVGQIRTDKNLPMLVAAAGKVSLNVAIMGKDTGGLSELTAAGKQLGMKDEQFLLGYFPLEDMAGLIAACGLVALPYSVASQSGVAALAHAYGAKVLARKVGGLAEQVDYVVDTLQEEMWSTALHTAASEVRKQRSETHRFPVTVKASDLNQLMEALDRVVVGQVPSVP